VLEIIDIIHMDCHVCAMRGGTKIANAEEIMDKRKVIAAYRSGQISLQECAQILGVDNMQWIDLIRETDIPASRQSAKQSVRL